MTEKQEKIKTAREVALEIVMNILENDNFSHKVINSTLNEYQYMEKQDRALITRICEGTVERLITLDYIINTYSTVKVQKMKPLIRNLLRISVYQLKYMEGIPDSAACNEAVKIAKKRGFSNLSGFVNGVLRNIIRKPEALVYPEEEKKPVQYLSVLYSVPEWLVEKLLSQYDYNVVKNMFINSLMDKKTTLRCNLNKITVEELKEQLIQSEVQVTPGTYLPYALQITKYNYLNSLETFKKGYFQIQDESSMLVGEASGVKPEDYVIDVCAAPGGKSLHIAELLKGTGYVDSRDVSEMKVSLINENIERLGYTNIHVKVQDALSFDLESKEKADIVIADLPCSGLGVIAKKSDIKYKMTEEKLISLVQLQRNILETIQQYVKKNGVLIYSTCTVNQEENIENVRWFLDKFNFKLESLDDYLPNILHCETTKLGYIQFVPGVHNTDGFFIARLRKCNE